MTATLRFDGRVAIVTGGAAGIGYATAKAYADEGATVVIADVDAEKLHAARSQLGVDGIAGDLTDEADVESLVAHAVDAHGRVDILVNLAGIYPFAGTEEETLANWKRVLAVNLDATFLCCQKVLPHMREQGYGRIVNTSSGTFRSAPPGLTAYVTAKGGVIGFTRVLATENGEHGVTANVIMPGLVATQHLLDMFGEDQGARAAFLDNAIAHQSVKRHGQSEDVAHGILFLTEEKSGFISGQTLQVDGGWTFT